MIKRQTIVVLVVLLAAVAAVYGRSLGFAFLSWDDDQNVTGNALLVEGPWWRFWTEPFLGLYIPPIYSLWSLLAKIHTPLNPVLFHGANILLHMGNTLLVYLLARRFLEQRSAWVAAAFAALMFALHPLQVESVAWVSGGRDLLCAFWALLATRMYLQADGRFWRYFGAWLVFVMALLSKPSAVALPAGLMLLDIVACQAPWKKVLLRLLPWFALVPPTILITQRVQAEGVDQALSQLVLWQRLLVAMDSFGFYVGKLLWPWALAIDYGHTPQDVLAGKDLVWDLGVLAAAGAVVLLFRKQLGRTGIGWLLWGAALMLPTSGLIAFSYQHTSTVADHYMYLPLAGFGMAAAWVISGVQLRRQQGFALALVAVVAITSSLRLSVWTADETLYPTMVASKPRSFAGLIGMAAMALRAKKYDEALVYVNKAQEIEPMNVAALADKGLALARLERYDEIVSDLGTKMPDRQLILSYPLSAPDMATLLMTVAFAHIKKGDIEKSLPVLCRAKFADARNPDVLTFMPMVATHLGKAVDDAELCTAEYRR